MSTSIVPSPLTSIANRLTPSTPIQLTFGAAPPATGVKFATLFGHMAASGFTATPYQVYQVQNVGDPVAGPAEVQALAGAGAEITSMVSAFIESNAFGGQGNFPNFRVVLIPFGVTGFGPNQEAITAVQHTRNDLFVSCYPASDSGNLTILEDLAIQQSGIDRDLNGQFGSFVVVGSLDSATVQEAYDINSQYVMVAGLPDSNTASVPILGSTTALSPIISAVTQPALTPTGTFLTASTLVTVSDSDGIYPGASITGTGIPANTTVETISGLVLTISNLTTSPETTEALVITNLPTAGIYPGALASGTGIPSGATVVSVTATTVTLSVAATSSNVSEAITFANQLSNSYQQVASAFAAGLLASAFPYNPLQGVSLGGLVPPQKASDWILFDPNGPSEALLIAGIAPLAVQGGSTVVFVRSRTTWVMNGAAPVNSYFDWQDLVTINDYKEQVFYGLQLPPFNGNPGGTKASAVTAALVKDLGLQIAFQFEAQNAFQGVKTLAPFFTVQLSTSQRGRFDFFFPINVLPGLFVVAGNIQAQASLGNFTL